MHFCGQSGCRCRHSAVNCSISISSPAQCVKNWPLRTQNRKNHAFLRSKCMSMSPLYGKLLNFSIVSRPARQKSTSAIPKLQKPCMFCNQSACRCRHSAVNCSISISSPAQRVKNWPENAKIGPPGNYFVDFWTQGQKMFKSDFLGLILSTSGPKARKCLNRTS
jgi:hypothetical protein